MHCSAGPRETPRWSAAPVECLGVPAAILAEPRVTHYYEAIERYHLNERLGEVLRALEPDTATRADLCPAAPLL